MHGENARLRTKAYHYLGEGMVWTVRNACSLFISVNWNLVSHPHLIWPLKFLTFPFMHAVLCVFLCLLITACDTTSTCLRPLWLSPDVICWLCICHRVCTLVCVLNRLRMECGILLSYARCQVSGYKVWLHFISNYSE